MVEKAKVIKKTTANNTKAVTKSPKTSVKKAKPVAKAAKSPAKKTTKSAAEGTTTTIRKKTTASSAKPAAKNEVTATKGTKKASPKNLTSVQKPVGKAKVRKVMKEFKEKELHSGSKIGPKVKNREQAIAIALSEGRKAESGKYKAKKTPVRKKSK